MKNVRRKVAATTLGIIIIGLFFAFGCKKDDPVTPSPTYPIEVSFMEYSLEGTSCQWTNLAYDNTVIVINSDEKMNRYVTGSGYLEIDFETQTLLLASGKAEKGISEITVNNLQQLSANEYELDMELLLNEETIAEEWTVALVLEKVSEESAVELIVVEYPIEILFTEYFIYWDDSRGYWQGGVFYSNFPCWENLNHDVWDPDYEWEGKLSIINNSEKLEHYLSCPEDYPAIDFSRYTLVLASGLTEGNNGKIYDMIFLKNSANQYTLKATIPNGALGILGYWCIAILIPKIEDEATVTFCRIYTTYK